MSAISIGLARGPDPWRAEMDRRAARRRIVTAYRVTPSPRGGFVVDGLDDDLRVVDSFTTARDANRNDADLGAWRRWQTCSVVEFDADLKG